MKKVLVFGSFDPLHEGHNFFLRTAKKYGDLLLVAVARDDYLNRFKKKEPHLNQKERLRRVRETGIPNKVFLSDEEPGSFRIIKETCPGVICLGHDQIELYRCLDEWIKENDLLIDLIRLPAYRRDIYSSSSILKKTK